MRARHIQRMIDQRLHAFEKAHGVRQSGVGFEYFFARPARVNIEKPRIADRAEGVNAHAAGLLARRNQDIVYRVADGRFVPWAGVKAPEDVKFHAASRLLLLSLTMTASQLRAKYGAPLVRETFTISPGFEIVVDYAAGEQVKRIELPGTAPDESGVSTPQRVDEALLELVPMSMRGKEIGSGLWRIPYSTKHTLYEHVMIIEQEDPRVPDRRRSVTVQFRDHYQFSSTS